MADDVNQHKRRCPRLGHDLTFEYCRSTDGGVPAEWALANGQRCSASTGWKQGVANKPDSLCLSLRDHFGVANGEWVAYTSLTLIQTTD